MPAHLCKHFFPRGLAGLCLMALGLTLGAAVPGWCGPHGYRGNHDTGRNRGSAYENRGASRENRFERSGPRAQSSYGNNRLNDKARQWETMPPHRQDELRHRMDRFKSLPPEERRLYRKRYDQLQQLPPDQQKEIRSKLRRMDRLSPEEKEEIRRKFE